MSGPYAWAVEDGEQEHDGREPDVDAEPDADAEPDSDGEPSECAVTVDPLHALI